MVSLEPSMQYCARGTVDLRIRNDLWADITIVEAELALGYMFIDYKTKAHFAPEGFLTIDGTTIKAMSERVYILPVHLQWTTFEEYSISSFSFYDIDIELRALGYRFRTLLRYGVIQVPNFTLPLLSS
ncbi:hypothetical protein FOZ60_010521 [Perkinsus olseni]|uniref:Uncharacterized protein n=1 Tax=Perkinsus olseni TaxID=32597 RepID=A0A7J6PCV0_PEROL|nr:hypothetical protein FOZ60_010521 [Perkinsus olseni]